MITLALLEQIAPTRGLNPAKFNLVRHRAELVDALNKYLPEYKINNYRRVCAFLATCGLETDYFRTTVEYASGADYEGRKDLGNTKPGDGRRYKGRGIIQTTGRYNYTKIGFEKNPEKLAEVDTAVKSACEFWKDHNLNAWADKKEFKALNGIVNRGSPDKTPLHWDRRNSLYSLCLRKVSPSFKFEVEEAEVVPPVEEKAPEASATELVKKYGQHLPSDTVKNVAGVCASRAAAGVTAAWSFGFTWRVILIAAIVPVGLALWYYRKRIIGWAKQGLELYFGGIF